MNGEYAPVGRGSRKARAAIERELRMMAEAIAMVASGAAPRVVVAGIHQGAGVIDPACQMALEAGVRINPLRLEESGADLAVEPIN